MKRLLHRHPSLQTRLLLLVLGFVVAVWLGASLVTWQDARHEMDELLDDHLSQAATLMMVQAIGDHDDIAEEHAPHGGARRVVFQVFVEGQLVTRSANVGTTPLTARHTGFDTVQLAGGLWRVVAVHSADHDVTVLLGEEVDSRKAILRALMGSLLKPFAFAFPLLGLALWWSVRRALAPLHGLRVVLEQRAPYATEPLAVQDLPRELQPLVQTLNDLLARIDRMVQGERRFTADAAHELRTPIAAIRAQAQVALGAGDDVVERVHALQTTLAGCDRASHLVDQLLTLARLEAAPSVPASTVDLGAVVRRVVAELAPFAMARQQDISVHAETPCPVAANALLLGVLVRNLVDNALRYSPNGARVEVQVHTDAQGSCLQVQDSGPGMTDEAIAHLGERFFRVLGNEQPGSGLGWSIVRRLLDVFGAQVQIGRAQALGGLSVTVHWPDAALP